MCFWYTKKHMLVPQNKIFVFANWKTKPASYTEAKKIIDQYPKATGRMELVAFPPYPFMGMVQSAHSPRRLVGAQDITEFVPASSFVGGVTPAQLSSMGMQYVIIGHSAVREDGQTDDEINAKIRILLENDMIPVVCIGEHVRDASGDFFHDLEDQIQATFEGLSKKDFESIIIAYEPLWAIGNEALRDATPDEVEETVIFIKRAIGTLTGNQRIGKITVIYGGSVSHGDQVQAMIHAGCQGVLIGRASLDIKQLDSIVEGVKIFRKKK